MEIDPEMRDALLGTLLKASFIKQYLGYSVSLANESYDNEALIQLERWINIYKQGAWKSEIQSTRPNDLLYQSYIDPIRFEKVCSY